MRDEASRDSEMNSRMEEEEGGVARTGGYFGRKDTWRQSTAVACSSGRLFCFRGLERTTSWQRVDDLVG